MQPDMVPIKKSLNKNGRLSIWFIFEGYMKGEF